MEGEKESPRRSAATVYTSSFNIIFETKTQTARKRPPKLFIVRAGAILVQADDVHESCKRKSAKRHNRNVEKGQTSRQKTVNPSHFKCGRSEGPKNHWTHLCHRSARAVATALTRVPRLMSELRVLCALGSSVAAKAKKVLVSMKINKEIDMLADLHGIEVWL
ncbi:hypothetical protein K438DRAFT_1790481 [Mycena galopus ATCC 62051]|nr:hypothetical protein K438DRAFT_1790481 [Mycena galopus ATCC 62051]